MPIIFYQYYINTISNAKSNINANDNDDFCERNPFD